MIKQCLTMFWQLPIISIADRNYDKNKIPKWWNVETTMVDKRNKRWRNEIIIEKVKTTMMKMWNPDGEKIRLRWWKVESTQQRNYDCEKSKLRNYDSEKLQSKNTDGDLFSLLLTILVSLFRHFTIVTMKFTIVVLT